MGPTPDDEATAAVVRIALAAMLPIAIASETAVLRAQLEEACAARSRAERELAAVAARHAELCEAVLGRESKAALRMRVALADQPLDRHSPGAAAYDAGARTE